MVDPLFDMFTAAMFISSSVRFLNMCKPRAGWPISTESSWIGLAAYQAGWVWWIQAGLFPSDQNFSCKWKLSFSRLSNRLPFYLGSPLHAISSLFSHFCMFQNAILRKMLKLGFWSFNPIFLRIQFSLVSTFFFSSFAYLFELIFASYTVSRVFNIYIF